MSGGSAIRGSRVGAGPMGEAERGEAAPREYVSYFCANHHVIRPAFAAEAEIPDTWECPRCGLPAYRSQAHPPAPRMITGSAAVQTLCGGLLVYGTTTCTPTHRRSDGLCRLLSYPRRVR